MKQPHCGRCKATDVPLINYSTRNDKKYYHCRTCNAQRARDYYKRTNGEASKRANYACNKRNRLKVNSRQMLNRYVQKGLIVRPTQCQKCFTTERRIEAHHHDYTKPLEVEWLCTWCHADAEKLSTPVNTQP